MDFRTERALITVKTYPTPARRGIEVSCTAGITESGEWIRLFPMPFRFLEGNRQFRKYQWVSLRVKKATDPRPESHLVDLDSIVVEPNTPLSWAERWEVIQPLSSPSLCHLFRMRQFTGATLGIFKPHNIRRLVIERDDEPNWTKEQEEILSQESMYDSKPYRMLEKIPYKFSYEFTCSDLDCKGHRLSITDWEVSQAYRNWRRRYLGDWERYFRQKFEVEMVTDRDTHFIVGTIRAHPHIWTIIGLFYPPKGIIPNLKEV